MTTQSAQPPFAQIHPRELEIHGDVRIDNYHWLRNRDDTSVIEYLTAENEYTDACMKHTKSLQETLFEEMKGRIQETDSSAPVRIDDYEYYWRTEEGKQYAIRCRRAVGSDTEEVLLDENEMAAIHNYFSLGNFVVSPDHRLLAYTADTSGGESYALYVKDLTTGELIEDGRQSGRVGLYYGLAWANDSQTLFYVTHDEAIRPDKVNRYHLGQPREQDALVFHDPDESYFVSIRKTRSQSYLLIQTRSKLTSEVWSISLDTSDDSEPVVIQPRVQGIEYIVDQCVYQGQDMFLISTNWKAQNFRLMIAPVSSPSMDNWQELIAHRPDVKIDRIESFQSFIALHERSNGLQQIRIMQISQDAQADSFTANEHLIEMPEPVYTLRPGDNPTFDTPALRFVYSSLTTPPSVYDYDTSTRTRTLRKRDAVLGGYDAANYQTDRLFATADDGAEIPISLVYRKDLFNADAPNLVHLYGYGSYGASIDPSFSSTRISLLDRGFVFAIAHIRGGGTMGRHWYETGKFLTKKNTFTDFIACAEHLVTLGYTTPAKMAMVGRSAGGLLMGAVLNMRPDLFGAVVADVPFVDVVTTMLDPSIPLTVTEWEEWGNPNDATYYAYMKSYSPYDNVETKAYPPILVTAGLNDPRVQYWEPAKWVAKLRRTKTDANPLLMKTNMSAGHGGASGRYDFLKEIAFEIAFLVDVMD
ncbi:MAG: S9 family peptidase [Chloroflexota bacterium]